MMAALGIIVPTAKLQDHKDYSLYGARAAYKCFLEETILYLSCILCFQNKTPAVLLVTRLAQSDGCPTQPCHHKKEN